MAAQRAKLKPAGATAGGGGAPLSLAEQLKQASANLKKPSAAGGGGGAAAAAPKKPVAELSFAEQIAMASKGLKKVERKQTIKQVLEKEEKRITESQIAKLSFAE